jgi:hypothetical protein
MKVAAALLTSTSSGASRHIFHHGIDRGAVADIAADHANLAAESPASAAALQQFEPAAANDQLGAELDKRVPSQPRARTATGDQYPLSRQQALFKHRLIRPS